MAGVSPEVAFKALDWAGWYTQSPQCSVRHWEVGGGGGAGEGWESDVLAFWSCCDKRPQTWWLHKKTAYPLSVLEARLPLEAPGEGPARLVQLPGLPVILGWKVDASLQSLPPSSRGLSLGVCFPSYKDTRHCTSSQPTPV